MKNKKIYRHYGLVAFEKITEYEKSIHKKLPCIYKKIIHQHDALCLEENSFNFNNVYYKNGAWGYSLIEGLDSRSFSFLGYGDTLPDYKKIQNQDFDVFGNQEVIAFGYSADGDHICFDYRLDPQTDEPSVVLMFHDAYDANNKMLICHVANSFEEFMDSLYKYEDEE